MSKSTDNVIRCSDVNMANFSLSEIDTKNDRSKTQFICYPRYSTKGNDSSNFSIQTDVIQMTDYGIPRLDDQYCPTDEKRDFFKIPLDPNQPACMKLREVCIGLDEYAENNKESILKEFLKKAVGQKAREKLMEEFKYVPIVRTPQATDELLLDDSSQKKDKSQKPEFIKVKLNTEFGVDKQKIKTLVFAWTGESDIDLKKAKGNIVEKKVTNATELLEYFNYKCHAVFIIMANKLYISKAKKDGFRTFGFTLKCMQLITKPNTSTSSGATFQQFAFLGGAGDEEDEESPMPLAKNTTKNSSSSGAKSSSSNAKTLMSALDGEGEEDDAASDPDNEAVEDDGDENGDGEDAVEDAVEEAVEDADDGDGDDDVAEDLAAEDDGDDAEDNPDESGDDVEDSDYDPPSPPKKATGKKVTEPVKPVAKPTVKVAAAAKESAKPAAKAAKATRK